MAKKNVDLITGHQELISFDLSLKKKKYNNHELLTFTYVFRHQSMGVLVESSRIWNLKKLRFGSCSPKARANFFF